MFWFVFGKIIALTFVLTSYDCFSMEGSQFNVEGTPPTDVCKWIKHDYDSKEIIAISAIFNTALWKNKTYNSNERLKRLPEISCDLINHYYGFEWEFFKYTHLNPKDERIFFTGYDSETGTISLKNKIVINGKYFDRMKTAYDAKKNEYIKKKDDDYLKTLYYYSVRYTVLTRHFLRLQNRSSLKAHEISFEEVSSKYLLNRQALVCEIIDLSKKIFEINLIQYEKESKARGFYQVIGRQKFSIKKDFSKSQRLKLEHEIGELAKLTRKEALTKNINKLLDAYKNDFSFLVEYYINQMALYDLIKNDVVVKPNLNFHQEDQLPSCEKLANILTKKEIKIAQEVIKQILEVHPNATLEAIEIVNNTNKVETVGKPMSYNEQIHKIAETPVYEQSIGDLAAEIEACGNQDNVRKNKRVKKKSLQIVTAPKRDYQEPSCSSEEEIIANKINLGNEIGVIIGADGKVLGVVGESHPDVPVSNPKFNPKELTVQLDSVEKKLDIPMLSHARELNKDSVPIMKESEEGRAPQQIWLPVNDSLSNTTILHENTTLFCDDMSEGGKVIEQDSQIIEELMLQDQVPVRDEYSFNKWRLENPYAVFEMQEQFLPALLAENYNLKSENDYLRKFKYEFDLLASVNFALEGEIRKLREDKWKAALEVQIMKNKLQAMQSQSQELQNQLRFIDRQKKVERRKTQ